MKRLLHEADEAQRILSLTADTLLLINEEGICIDIDVHSNLWFIQEKYLLGKNILNLLPEYTREKVEPVFRSVIEKQQNVTQNFKLPLKRKNYYFKCIMQPYNGLVLCQYRDITERSNIKQQLEQTNHILKEIQKVARIGHWTYSSKNRIFHYTGYTGIMCKEDKLQDISFDDYLNFIQEEDRPIFLNWYNENLKGGATPAPINYRVTRNNKTYHTSLQTYIRKELSHDNIYMEGYIQNVTDVHRQKSDINTLQHAINNAKESIFAAKLDGSVIFANQRFRDYYDISADKDVTQMKIYDLTADINTLQIWQQHCKDIKEGRITQFISYNPVKGKKDILAFKGTMYCITNDAGEDCFWSFTNDISEQLRYESRIKQLNHIMDITINNLPASIVVKDITDNFRYLYRNKESYNRDITFNDAIGKSDFDFYPPYIAKEKQKEDLEVASTGKELHWITEERDNDGNLVIFDKRKIRIDGDTISAPIILSIEWDITELERTRRELQKAKEKAEMSDKLKSAFLANMSHEIRTPLNAIVGFSQLIAESNNPEEREQFYDIVKANNERLLNLINEILDLSKIESGILEFHIAPTNIHTLCKEVHDAHIFRMPEGVKLVFEPSDDTIVLDTDKNRVFQVISNMIGNAIKFTKMGSINFGYEVIDNKVLFHVTDTGMGIEPEKLGRVFDRFAKLNNCAQGTGLRLSICKSIVERLGGTISVSSEVGVGTTFMFTLPFQNGTSPKIYLQDKKNEKKDDKNDEKQNGEKQNGENTEEIKEMPAQTAAQNCGEIPVSPSDHKLCIMIAEDTDCNYDLLNAILRNSYRLERAKDGMEAVLMYDELKPDLILMDIKMPNLDGLEATKIIRELSATVPIIIQSAYAYDDDIKAAKEAGCNDFIAKPISKNKLLEMIEKWLPKE